MLMGICLRRSKGLGRGFFWGVIGFGDRFIP